MELDTYELLTSKKHTMVKLRDVVKIVCVILIIVLLIIIAYFSYRIFKKLDS